MPKRTKKREFLKGLFLTASFIALFILTSSYNLDFLIWLVNVPLLLLVYGKPLKKAALLALPLTVLAVFISFTWVVEYSWSAYLLSSVLFSGFLFLFAVFFNILSKNINGYFKIFAAPFIYSCIKRQRVNH